MNLQHPFRIVLLLIFAADGLFLLGGCQSYKEFAESKARTDQHLALNPLKKFDLSDRVDPSQVVMLNTDKSPIEVYAIIKQVCEDDFHWRLMEERSGFDPWYSRLQFETASQSHVIIESECIQSNSDLASKITCIDVRTGMWRYQEEDFTRRIFNALKATSSQTESLAQPE